MRRRVCERSRGPSTPQDDSLDDISYTEMHGPWSARDDIVTWLPERVAIAGLTSDERG